MACYPFQRALLIAGILLVGIMRSSCLAVTIHPVWQWVSAQRHVLHDALPKGIENWGLDNSGFALSLTLETNTFRQGDPISLRLVCKNVSQEDSLEVYGLSAGLRTDIEITVLDANGEPVLVNPDAEAERKSGRSSGKSDRCPVGFALVESVSIGHVFQFKPEHTYYVYAAKKVADLKTGKRSQVTSGNAIFRITAPNLVAAPQTLLTNSPVPAAASPNPKRAGITLPLPAPQTRGNHPIRPSAAFAASAQSSDRLVPVTRDRGSLAGPQVQSPSAVLAQASPPERNGMGAVGLAGWLLLGLPLAVLLWILSRAASRAHPPKA
jgi:hypothetical protein